MRKQSKMVERAELNACKADRDRHAVAVRALLNGETSKAYRIAETVHQAGVKGNSYTFRFIQQGNGYDIVIVTFRCESTGQRDSTSVYDVDQQREYAKRCPGVWAWIFESAYSQWRHDLFVANEKALGQLA